MATINLFTTREISRTVTERVDEQTFIARIKRFHPESIYCEGWHETPVIRLSGFTMTGCKYRYSGAAKDTAPKWVPYKSLYKIMRNEMSSCYFKKEKRRNGPDREDLGSFT